MELGIIFPIGLLLIVGVAIALTLMQRARRRPEDLPQAPPPLANRPGPGPVEDQTPGSAP